MPIATEKELWRALKQRCPGPHWTRIESGATGRGVPDIEGCYCGHPIWIESKVVRGRQVSLTPLQVKWHEWRHDAGGHSFILATDPARDRLLLWRGGDARQVACHGLDCDPIWEQAQPVNWEQLQRRLFLGQA